MSILINNTPHDLPAAATLSDAVAAIAAVQPFAVAVNGEFVPRSGYAKRQLQPNDRIEVIRPVTGG